MSASTQAHQSLSGSVAALCSAYHETSTIIQRIKAEKSRWGPAAQELETSINKGESAVTGQFERIKMRFGEGVNDEGDRTSSASRNIII